MSATGAITGALTVGNLVGYVVVLVWLLDEPLDEPQVFDLQSPQKQQLRGEKGTRGERRSETLHSSTPQSERAGLRVQLRALQVRAPFLHTT